jgi:lysophospholipase L1-like esterase
MKVTKWTVALAAGAILMTKSTMWAAPAAGPAGIAQPAVQVPGQMPPQAGAAEKGTHFSLEATGGKIPVDPAFHASEGPFAIAIDVPNGNYDVTVKLGGPAASITTVKSEMRRLSLESIATAPGQTVTRTFTVNVRDGQLNLEFLGEKPSLASLEVKADSAAPTVYLAGDSTVTDQEKEPWAGWGMMLPRFFKPGVAVANHAHSGRALKSFIWEKRLDAILATMKPGDYLFIQFTHNDQKPGAAHVEPFTTFKEQLQIYIDAARQHGATPVLVTSMHRRRFDANGHIENTLSDYPEAMRQKAQEEHVALIDLNAMSKVLYEAWGPEESKKAFVHYPANTFPGQTAALKDDTHFNAYGAYELARCVVEGLKQTDLPLKQFLLDDTGTFDPAKPDAIASIQIPPSPFASTEKPEGN